MKDKRKARMSLIHLLVILIIIPVSCTPKPGMSPTETDMVPSETASLTGTPTSSSTPNLPTPTNTSHPVTGTALWQINVRNGPGVQYTLIGKINQGEVVQILGQDPTSEWYKVVFADSSNGEAWVTAEYVKPGDNSNIPIVGLVSLYNGTPAPQGTLTEKVNVRSGPGTHYDSIGILPADVTIWAIGRNEDGSWLLIQYPSGEGGTGWIISGYVIVQDIMGLPYVDSSGVPIQETAGTFPEKITSTPTAGITIAYDDGDSIVKPSHLLVISSIGINKFIFSSDLSQPDGDHSDWLEVQFNGSNQLETATLSASLSCNGMGTIRVTLLENKRASDNWTGLSCGDQNQEIIINSDTPYLFQFEIIDQSSPTYVEYTLKIGLIN